MPRYCKIVDELGTIKAKIADLTAQEKLLKSKLPVGEHNGFVFRATVTAGERRTLDMEAVYAKLTTQFVKAHTNVSPTITVRVVARVRDRQVA